MKEKKSLLKAIFSKETFDANNEKDERITLERNKIMYRGMNILTFTLVLMGILSDAFRFRMNCMILFIIIGIIYFGMLLYYCKKNIVNQQSSVDSFIWSIVTLPLSISNLFCSKVITDSKIFLMVQPISIIVLIVVMYEIANIVYKKYNKD